MSDERILVKSVSGLNPEGGFFTYEAGTKASDMAEGDADCIVNPKAWGEPEEEDEVFGLVPGYTREDLVKAASATADTTGEGRPDSEDELSEMKVPELRSYAEDNGIDLGEATRKQEILKAIRDHQAGAGNS